MANINHQITLGIGTPAGILEFMTFGLQIGAITQGAIKMVASPQSRKMVPNIEERSMTATPTKREMVLNRG